MTKRTRITHFVSPNNFAGSTVRSYSTTEGTRKVCTGGILVTYDYDISLHLPGYPCSIGSQDQVTQNLHFQKSFDGMTMSQIKASSKDEYDLLKRSASRESFHPEHEKLFRLTPAAQMVICNIPHPAMASVGHNPSVRSSARLQRCQNSKPRDRWTKVCVDCARSNFCTCICRAPLCPAQSALLVMAGFAVTKPSKHVCSNSRFDS